MPSNKRVRAARVVTFDVIMSVSTFAAPANAADNGYTSPITGTKVLGVTASANALRLVVSYCATRGAVLNDITVAGRPGVGRWAPSSAIPCTPWALKHPAAQRARS
jgi:hypothetical protein